MIRFFAIFFRTLLVLAAAAFIAMFAYTIMIGILNIGNIAGIALCVWVILVSVKPLHHAIRDTFKRHGFTKFLYRLVNAVFIVLAVYGTIATGAIIGVSMIPPKENATAVVLGAQVRPTGNPSTILRGRINAAENYLTENEKTVAVLSGGKGTDEVMSEAQCMFVNMTDEGIGSDRLYIEDKSTTTRENFIFSEKIIKENGLNQDIAVTTDRFHQLRARLITMQLGIEGEVGAVNSDTAIYYAATYTVREWFALPYEFIKNLIG